MADRIVQLSDDESNGKATSQSTKCSRCGYHLHAYDFDMDRLGRVTECCPVCTGRVKRVAKVERPVHRCGYCSEALDHTYAPTATVCRRCAPRSRTWAKCVDCGANTKATRCGGCTRKHNLNRQRAQEQARRDRMRGYFAAGGLNAVARRAHGGTHEGGVAMTMTAFLLRCARNHRRAPDEKPRVPPHPYVTNEQLSTIWQLQCEWDKRNTPRLRRNARKARLQSVRVL